MSSEVKIQKASISTISISAPPELKEASRMAYIRARNLAEQYGGHILRHEEFSDGFFLEVSFVNEGIKNVWENELPVR